VLLGRELSAKCDIVAFRTGVVHWFGVKLGKLMAENPKSAPYPLAAKRQESDIDRGKRQESDIFGRFEGMLSGRERSLTADMGRIG
jgi:hypothetical protein